MNQLSFHEVKLHPASYRHLALGHPWVKKDKFTDQFGGKKLLLTATDLKTNNSFVLLNDSKHPKIKARLWSVNESPDDFLTQFKARLDTSLQKRIKQPEWKLRENFYLVFGEADELPGLQILRLSTGVLIQTYSYFWQRVQKDIIPILKEKIAHLFDLTWIAWQERNEDKKNILKPLWGKVPSVINLCEFGVKYQLTLENNYDLGIYTDMSSLRYAFKDFFKDRSFLNLYAYTGAWSLFALKNGATSATSIDLSPHYIEWLERNLENNNMANKHHSLVTNVTNGLNDLLNKNECFDFILNDPPSFSSDGNKTNSSLKSYKTDLPLIEKLLRKGGHALCFLNTHSVSRNKFESELSSLSRMEKVKSFSLMGDCPLRKNFPEGDYLKGILFRKKESS